MADFVLDDDYYDDYEEGEDGGGYEYYVITTIDPVSTCIGGRRLRKRSTTRLLTHINR